MKIITKLKTNKTTLSFEFFPPRSQKASESLFKTMNNLLPLKPSYVSVTYGAGGSSRKLTHNLVLKIHQETDLTVVPHLTCTGSTRDEIFSIINEYHKNDIKNIMALKGDPLHEASAAESFFKHAADLIVFIKENFSDMSIGVAGFPEGHPQTPNRLLEMKYLKQKVDAGADYICTQLFFDNRDFYDFCERCELADIKVPIIAGIMPITSFKNMDKMAELAGGIRFPASLLRLLNRAQTSQQVENAGIHWAAEQIRDLLDHKVRGVHFYTLNKSGKINKICEAIGITSSDQLL